MSSAIFNFTMVVVGARELRNVGTFGKMDIYACIRYGNNVYRTTVIEDSGCSAGKICVIGPTTRVELRDEFSE